MQVATEAQSPLPRSTTSLLLLGLGFNPRWLGRQASHLTYRRPRTVPGIAQWVLFQTRLERTHAASCFRGPSSEQLHGAQTQEAYGGGDE